ncbi:MAG: RsmD family RNA methyltransferase, partial [Desulfobulbaceae bacterium]|nr:RsmD family RNA methyltransferase [Desulfobulbaceae bacterium]
RDLAKGLFFLKQASPAGGFEIIFLDPPYGRQLGQKVLQELGEGGILSASGLVVAEEEAGAEFDDSYGILRLHDRRRYGDTGFWLYRREERGIQ